MRSRFTQQQQLKEKPDQKWKSKECIIAENKGQLQKDGYPIVHIVELLLRTVLSAHNFTPKINNYKIPLFSLLGPYIIDSTKFSNTLLTLCHISIPFLPLFFFSNKFPEQKLCCVIINIVRYSLTKLCSINIQDGKQRHPRNQLHK